MSFTTSMLRWLATAWPSIATSMVAGAISGAVAGGAAVPATPAAASTPAAPSTPAPPPVSVTVTPLVDEATPPPVVQPKKAPKPKPRGPSRMDQCLAEERRCEGICGDVGFSCRNSCGSTNECKQKCDPQEDQCKRTCGFAKNRCVNP